MRIALFPIASTIFLLAGCGGPETSQANNAQANISDAARPPATSVATTTGSPTGQALTKDEALKVMHDRHEAMEKIGKATKAIKRELDGSNPDLGTVRASAKVIADLSAHVGSLFPKGTGPDVGKTGAKPEIWQNPEDFTAKVGDFQKAAQAFNSAAAGDNVDAVRSAFGDLGKSCKACHDKYRAEMKH